MFHLVAALSLLVQSDAPEVIRLYPIDETARDSSFRSYVAKLRSAVDSRDTRALRKLVHDDVFAGPRNDDKGWSKFVERWRPDDRTDPGLWTALSDLLSFGFVREHPALYLSPYLVWRFPRHMNPAAHLVITRDKAALRERPALDGRVSEWLSFDVVRRLGGPEDRSSGLNQWFRVETLDGKSGYVNARDVSSPMLPRAQFSLERGRWAMTALERP